MLTAFLLFIISFTLWLACMLWAVCDKLAEAGRLLNLSRDRSLYSVETRITSEEINAFLISIGAPHELGAYSKSNRARN